MGDFASWLNAGASVIGAGTSAIGAGQRIKKQKEAQKELNEQAAKLNYDYGEKAAQNAFERQLQMYERSYQDQSFAAMRKQAEDAGLSIGMLYGNGGAGGQGGATSGAPQGETGGAQAGDAASMYANEIQRNLSLKQLALQNASLVKDLKIKDEEEENIKSDTAEKKARTKTENESRAARIEEIKQNARATWMANNDLEYKDLGLNLKDDSYAGVTLFRNDVLGNHSIVANRLKDKKDYNEVLQSALDLANTQADTELKGSEKAANNAYVNLLAIQEKLTNANIKKIFFDMTIDAFNADTMRLEANAKKLATDFQTGEHVNWKTYYDAAIEAAEAIGTIIGGIGLGKAVGTTLTRVMNPEEPPKPIKGFRK